MHTSWTRFAWVVLLADVKSVFSQLDPCAEDAVVRAADCADIVKEPACDETGEWCYIYDAAEAFCPEPFEFFLPADYFGIPAEGPPVCTTTTTSTFTVTSTTTCTTTIWTTTAPQPTECRNFCEENSHPWLVKCGWPVCASCTDCASVVIPTTESPTTTVDPIELLASSASSAIQEARSTTNTSNQTASEATSAANAGGSSSSSGGSAASYIPPIGTIAVNDDSLQQAASQAIGFEISFTLPPTTTKEPEESKTCLSMCYKAIINGMDWGLLCTWATCFYCPECDGTTTTTVAIMLETTTTSTRTATTLYPPTHTVTTTRTKSSTTRTATRTHTVTTTSTNRPCSAPSPVLTQLMAEDDCKTNISAGDFCIAPMIEHSCLYPGDLVFECPKGNIEYREPMLLSGNFQSMCKICGWADDYWEDMDWMPGKYRVRLRFGANARLGEVDESDIFGYGIFISDNCSRQVQQNLVHYIPKWNEYPHDDRCCTMDAYDTEFEFDAPPGYNNVSLMVRLNTSLGFLPIGAMTSEILDWNDTSQGRAGARRSADVAGFNSYLLALLSSMLVFRASSVT